MSFAGIGHVALFVGNLRQAERLYVELFGMTVEFREVATDGDVEVFDQDESWAELAALGSVSMSFCTRNGVTVALHEPDAPQTHDGPIDHLNVTVPAAERDHICTRAPEYDCAVDAVPYENDHRYITTPSGVTWELGVPE